MPTAQDLNQTGIELYVRGDHEGARLHYLAATRVDPGFLPTLANLSVVLGQANKLPSAIAHMRKLLELAPQDGAQWANLGNMLMRQGEYEEATKALTRAVEHAPDSVSTWHNKALLEFQRGQWDEALDSIDNVISFGKDTPEVQNDKAHMLLAKGDLGRALELYESRWHSLPHLQPWDYHIPEWQGEDLRGKRILLHAEQGFGDTIMCARFAKSLAALGAFVTLCVPPGLVSLFEAQEWPGVSVLDLGQMPDNCRDLFDFQSPMYSAMRWLGIKSSRDIDPRPYLSAPSMVLAPLYGNVLNVGICWASGKRNTELDWRRRVAPLEHWLTMATIPHVQLWSLQMGAGEEDIYSVGAEALIQSDHMSKITDWAETAAFIDRLDLVITVDTAVAHLAGALGKPVWMLSQFVPCWRWWNIDKGNGRPWYSSMSIFKQTGLNAWEGQLREVAQSLREYASTQPWRKLAA